MKIKKIVTQNIVTKFVESCITAEGDLNKTKVMWDLGNCKLHLLRTIESYPNKYDVNTVVRDFLEFCKKEEKGYDLELDLTQIKELITPFVEQYEQQPKDKVKDLFLTSKTSAFAKPFQKHDYSIEYLLLGLLTRLSNNRKAELRDNDAFLSVRDVKEACELILSNTANFQRNNDKWDTAKQQEFVFNLFAGYRDAVIVLYHLPKQEYDCKILDGLQRLTAVFRLLTDPTFMIPTKPLSERTEDDFIPASEFLTDKALMNILDETVLTVKTYEFESELAAVDHYIAINKGFTHSDADIQIALDYRAKLVA